MRVKAVQQMYYDRRMREIGEEYDMDDREEATAKLLEILGKVQIVKPAPVDAPAAPTYQATALEPEPVAEAEPMTAGNIDPLTGKRFYRRRDMRAEK